MTLIEWLGVWEEVADADERWILPKCMDNTSLATELFVFKHKVINRILLKLVYSAN